MKKKILKSAMFIFLLFLGYRSWSQCQITNVNDDFAYDYSGNVTLTVTAPNANSYTQVDWIVNYDTTTTSSNTITFSYHYGDHNVSGTVYYTDNQGNSQTCTFDTTLHFGRYDGNIEISVDPNDPDYLILKLYDANGNLINSNVTWNINSHFDTTIVGGVIEIPRNRLRFHVIASTPIQQGVGYIAEKSYSEQIMKISDNGTTVTYGAYGVHDSVRWAAYYYDSTSTIIEEHIISQGTYYNEFTFDYIPNIVYYIILQDGYNYISRQDFLGDCEIVPEYYIEHSTYDAATGVDNCEGSIYLQVNTYNSGSYNYTVEWSTGEIDNTNYSASVYNLCPGTYSVTITNNDQNCSMVLGNMYVESYPVAISYVDSFTNILDTCLPSSIDTFYVSQPYYDYNTNEFCLYWSFYPDITDTSNHYVFHQCYPFDTTGYYWLGLGFMCDSMNSLKNVYMYGRSVYVDPTITSVQTPVLENSINIYPNPVNEYATIEITSYSNAPVTVSITAADGSIISEKEYNLGKGKNKIELNTSRFKHGIYFVKIRYVATGEEVVKKIVK